MVRTKRSIEEEQRVRLLDQPMADPVVLRHEWMQAFTGGLVDKVVEWGARPSKRALVVGLEDHGNLAMRLLEKGMFVTVVDPVQQRIDALNDLAAHRGVGLKLNAICDEYIRREFARASFDLACLFSILARYSEPFVVVRKVKRELKAGAQVFARFRTRPDFRLPERIELPGPVTKAVRLVSDRVRPILENLLRLPTNAKVIEEMSREFTIQETMTKETLALPLTLFMGRLGLNIPFGRAFYVLDDLESRIPGRIKDAAGGSMAVFAVKEKELGTTFRPR